MSGVCDVHLRLHHIPCRIHLRGARDGAVTGVCGRVQTMAPFEPTGLLVRRSPLRVGRWCHFLRSGIDQISDPSAYEPFDIAVHEIHTAFKVFVESQP
jgi:hypothetical protein